MSTALDYGSYPLERPLSWQDTRDVFPLSSRQLQGYTYVDSSNRKYRKPPVHFSANITSIDGDCSKTTCYPGSTFAGYVQLNVEYPLAAQYLKLLFRATEHIYENNNRKVRVRLFAVRTVLWGSPNVTGSQWPVVEPGQHRFPFLCELPLVNYPPTFRHHLASCEFEILATLERPGIRPFQTIPVDIRYQPLVLTTSLKIPPAYQEEVNISNTKIIMTLPRGISYNLLDANSRGCLIDVKLTFPDGHPSISNMEASLRRQVHVSCRDYQQTDSMTMTHVEQSAFRTHEKSYYIKIPIPTENNPLNTPAIQRNFSVLGMTTSLVGHSRYTQVTYRLVITARIRHGFLFHKRTLFYTVIQMGTLSPGAQVPSSVFSCSSVPSNATMSIKPRFLYVPGTQEQLPAYQDEPSPPQYSL
ncbi:hypothetical protein CU098_014015 [Rhizopus stolonifer]|uniref:Arrestin-like N-terminal domain-containing protein n=1 Tax=Rhizopus stolonifer TaxID=4846 RepID=A0A367KYN5_RHIST|nr:hypothetical protein CU098_014015 [Rhizopus stolonifer]